MEHLTNKQIEKELYRYDKLKTFFIFIWEDKIEINECENYKYTNEDVEFITGIPRVAWSTRDYTIPYQKPTNSIHFLKWIIGLNLQNGRYMAQFGYRYYTMGVNRGDAYYGLRLGKVKERN